ncbi:MAG: serine hydrolase domain-containing protein [Polyangiaceae bacterium]
MRVGRRSVLRLAGSLVAGSSVAGCHPEPPASPCPTAVEPPPKVAAPPARRPLKGALEDALAKLYAHGSRGLCVVGFDRTSIRFQESLGLDDLGGEPTTLAFHVASVSKLFTGAALASLVRDAKLDWDEPFAAVCPSARLEESFANDGPLLLDVLSHRTGLPMWAGDMLWYRTRNPWSFIKTRLAAIKPTSPIRSSFSYSNLLVSALREAFESRAGLTWEQALTGYVLEPLGMSRTWLTDEAAARIDRLAPPMTTLDGSPVPAFAQRLDAVAPATGVRSCAADIVKLLQAQLAYRSESALWPPSILEPMWEPYLPLPFSAHRHRLTPETLGQATGLGCFVLWHAGRRLVCHGGALPGASSFAAFVPEEGVGLVLLSNADDDIFMRAALFTALDDLLGLEPSDWAQRFTEIKRADETDTPAPREPRISDLEDKDLKAIVGQYESPVYGTMTISEGVGSAQVSLEHHVDVRGQIVKKTDRGFAADFVPKHIGRVYFTAQTRKDKVVELVGLFGSHSIDGLVYRFKRV